MLAGFGSPDKAVAITADGAPAASATLSFMRSALLGLAAIAASVGCSDVEVVRTVDSTRAPFLRIHAGTVLHEGETWASTPVQLSVILYEDACGDCAGRIADATVRGGAAGELSALTWSDSEQAFVGAAPAGLELEFEIVVDGETTSLRVPTVSTFEVTVRPDPPALDQELEVAWSGDLDPETHAGVGVTTPSGEVLSFPPNGVGPDDGGDLLPATAFGESGSYELRIYRSLDVDVVVNDHPVRFDSALQVNLERVVP